MYEVAEMRERVEYEAASKQPVQFVHCPRVSKVEYDGSHDKSAEPITCGESGRHIEQTEFVKAELPGVIHESLRLYF
jgi:hypothetical protein